MEEENYRQTALEIVISVLEDIEKHTDKYANIYVGHQLSNDDIDQLHKRIVKIRTRIIRVLKLQHNENFVKFTFGDNNEEDK